ncbi:hypothetical protein ACVWWO_005199 [Bradyrhizobium sp. F1.13.1]
MKIEVGIPELAECACDRPRRPGEPPNRLEFDEAAFVECEPDSRIQQLGRGGNGESARKPRRELRQAQDLNPTFVCTRGMGATHPRRYRAVHHDSSQLDPARYCHGAIPSRQRDSRIRGQRQALEARAGSSRRVHKVGCPPRRGAIQPLFFAGRRRVLGLPTQRGSHCRPDVANSFPLRLPPPE